MSVVPVIPRTVAEWNCAEAGSTVYNLGPATVYYRDEEPVTSGVNDGSIAAGASAVLSGAQNFTAESAVTLRIVPRPPASTDAVFIDESEPVAAPAGALWLQPNSDGSLNIWQVN